MNDEERKFIRKLSRIYCVECESYYHPEEVNGFNCPKGHKINWKLTEKIERFKYNSYYVDNLSNKQYGGDVHGEV